MSELLFRAVDKAHRAGEPWAASWDYAALVEESKQAKIVVAKQFSGTESGFVFLRKPGALWEITLIFVLSEFRGTGAFEELIGAAKRMASEGAVGFENEPAHRRLGLEVRSDNNRARKAYDRVGFKEVAVRKGYYRDGCDALLLEMALEFDLATP